MRVAEIKAIAEERGIKAGKMKKEELIRAIQRDEGNSDCFGEGARVPCEQAGCLWFGDCQAG
jgi:hypothetical protein